MRQLKLAYVMAMATAYLFWPWTSYGQPLDISILDIGQGDSILITTPNRHHILIDGGPDDSVVDQIDAILPFWQRNIDAIIPTHPQADHITGLVAILQRFQVNRLLDTPAKANIAPYKSIKAEVEQQRISESYFLRGSTIDLDDGVDIKSLWPTDQSDYDHVKDLNDVAQVCLLSYGSFRALFTADAGANIDQKLESLGDTQHVDLLKVAHHGSKTGTDQHFLEDIHPLVSVISVGAENRYGHPATSTLKQLQSVGSQIWRTDQDGRVDIKVDGSGISVYSTK